MANSNGTDLGSLLAVSRMRIDIFPNLNLPVIYAAQPYGGMSPAQMEGYLVYHYEYHFLYINGIQSVEDKSIQGNGLLKLTFYSGTDMSQALAQTISYVNRARLHAARDGAALRDSFRRGYRAGGLFGLF